MPWLYGTNGNNVMEVTAPVITAHPTYEANQVDLIVYALGGDDTIVRDRTGAYGAYDLANKRYKYANLDGGAGFDIVDYSTADGPITARLDQTWTSAWVGGQLVRLASTTGYSLITSSSLPIPWENNWIRGDDEVTNIEGVVGTVFDDDLRGNDMANTFRGNDGDDLLYGNGGNDSLYGGDGDDFISGGTGHDYIDAGKDDDVVHAGTGNDTISAGDGDDVVHGQAGNDRIYAGDGNDYVRGGTGADVIQGGSGGNELYGDGDNDTFHLGSFSTNDVDGGSGLDTVVFTQKAVVNLFSGYAWRGPQGVEGTDTLTDVENVTTGTHADVVIGDDVRNLIRTNAGDDYVMALGGDDEIHGGNGADNLQGGDGEDFIIGGRGADRIRGGEGADTIFLGRNVETDTERDVLVWAAGDTGLDSVTGFSVAHDRLIFREGFLAAGAREDNLLVFFNGANAMLAANIAGVGWDMIADFKNVHAIALTNAIENGSIFSVQTTGIGDGAPGDFDAPTLFDTSAIGLQIVF